MEETTSKHEHSSDPFAAAQLEKLKLEIEQLKNNNGWEKAITSYTPLLSVLIAVGGFLFGIYQFQKQRQIQQTQILIEQQKDRQTRERDQAIRIQNQIRSNVEQILLFTNDKQQTVAKVSFLLSDLKSYLEISAVEDLPVDSEYRKESITASFVKSVIDDCNFDEHRDVNYALTLLTYWEDYERYIRNTRALEYILYMYSEALQHIYYEDPSAIRSVRYLGNYSYTFPRGYGSLSTSRIFHFEDIVMGFKEHFKLLEDEKIKEKSLKNFQSSTCNDALTEALFGIKVDRKSDPGSFAHCPR